MSTRLHRMHMLAAAPILLSAVAAGACELVTAPDGNPFPHEVWLIDQSDSPGRTYGRTRYVDDGDDVAGAANAAPRERIDLGEQVSSVCMSNTGANPVRPHMLVFNQQHTHALLSFVASGHVALIDAASRSAVGCVRTSLSTTGRQAHAAYPAPDGSFVVVANQNGKRLERINVDFATNTFVLDPSATLDLATCTTPSGALCQDAQLRPDNAPICPIVADDSRHTFITLRGGGLFVVDARTTPMTIVAEYDSNTVRGNGCGGTQVGGSMLVNSGGRPGNLPHLHLYGFDVYRFPVAGFSTGVPNMPAPDLVYSIAGEHDSHGMSAAGPAQRYVWVMDRHANSAEIIATATMQHVGSVSLAGALSSDPAPDLVDHSPLGDRLYVALRGSTPLSGDPHIATGSSPGLGIIDVNRGGRDGQLAAVLRISNVDAGGVERADAHAVRVRRK